MNGGIERACASDCHARVVRHVDAFQRVETTAHDDQIGAAIHAVSVIVARQMLHAEVTRFVGAYAHVPHTERGDVAQVALQHHAFGAKRRVADIVELRGELAFIRDDGLSASADSRRTLEPNRAVFPQQRGGGVGIVAGKCGISGENQIADPFAERVGPSRRLCARAGRQSVRDDLRCDERIRHHAAEKIVFARDTHAGGVVERERVVGNQIRMRMPPRSVEFAAKGCVEQPGNLHGEGALRIDFMLSARGLLAAAVDEHDQTVIDRRCLHARAPVSDACSVLTASFVPG